MQTDITLLKKYISLDFTPLSAKWTILQADRASDRMLEGPNDYNMKIVLRLSEADWQKIYKRNLASKDIHKQIFLKKDFFEKWFSEEVGDCFISKKNYYIISRKVIEPKDFFKSPFVNGFCFFADKNQIFIFLYTT